MEQNQPTPPPHEAFSQPQDTHHYQDFWLEQSVLPETTDAEAAMFQARQARLDRLYATWHSNTASQSTRVHNARAWYRGLGQNNDLGTAGYDLLQTAQIITQAMPDTAWSEIADARMYRLDAADMLTEASRSLQLSRAERSHVRIAARSMLQADLTAHVHEHGVTDSLDRVAGENAYVGRMHQLAIEEVADQFTSGEVTKLAFEAKIADLLLLEGASLARNLQRLHDLRRSPAHNQGDKDPGGRQTARNLGSALGSSFERFYVYAYRTLLNEHNATQDAARIRVATTRQDRGLFGDRSHFSHLDKSGNFDATVPVGSEDIRVQLKTDVKGSRLYEDPIATVYPNFGVRYDASGNTRPAYNTQLLRYLAHSTEALLQNTQAFAGRPIDTQTLASARKLIPGIKQAVMLPGAHEMSRAFYEVRRRYIDTARQVGRRAISETQ